jgi:hypothetical protein
MTKLIKIKFLRPLLISKCAKSELSSPKKAKIITQSFKCLVSVCGYNC